MRPDRLAGRTALVTGGSRGIGAAIVRAFAAEGCSVAFCHVDDDAGAADVVAAVTEAGGRASAWRSDVGELDDLRRFFAAGEAFLGQVDILVNNAGISGETPFEQITMAALERMFAVHVRASFALAQLCLPGMKARGFGRVINIASQLAYRGAAGLTHYTAAKAALVGFTRALAVEAAPHGVLVNAIAPGPVDTRLMSELTEAWKAEKRASLPLRRFGLPEEIAPTAVMLASADGAYYVGQTLSPNGGDVFL